MLLGHWGVMFPYFFSVFSSLPIWKIGLSLLLICGCSLYNSRHKSFTSYMGHKYFLGFWIIYSSSYCVLMHKSGSDYVLFIIGIHFFLLPFIKKTFSPLQLHWHFRRHSVFYLVWIYFWILYSIPLMCLNIWTLYYTNSVTVGYSKPWNQMV